MMMINSLIVALVFGSAAYLVLELAKSMCEKIVPYADGPMACVGFGLANRGASIPVLGFELPLCAALVACWYCDVKVGILPDVFTLWPLGFYVLLAVFSNVAPWNNASHYSTVISTVVAILVVALPFAVLAKITKGRGMGWGDVKLAALGGAILGMMPAVAAFATASFVAVVVALIRGKKTELIAFGPYLVGGIGFFMIFGLGMNP
jgi:prepilin signal peptidase PulO-like enzyme (type II secretory pathway)